MTIDERLENISRNLETLTRLHLDGEREWRARLEKNEETAAAAEERAMAAEERAIAAEERHDREMDAIRAELRHAVRLSIQEARAERSRRRKLDQKFDEKITQLAAAQIVTEEKLQRFLESRQHGNGKP